MADYAGTSKVTQAIQERLVAAFKGVVPTVNVNSGPPTLAAGAEPDPPVVDVFLYQVTPNAALRNHDLPTRRSDGSLTQRPKAAVDLHYLLTFRGKESDYIPQLLLGAAVETFHSEPFIVDLGDSPDVVKLALAAMSLEELTKLWSVLIQMPYRLSIAFHASVVLIEGPEVPKQALPVQDRRLYVGPFKAPVMESVVSAAGFGQPVTKQSVLVITGRQLLGESTEVVVGGDVAPTVAVSQLTNSEIRVDLNSFPGLIAGANAVFVRHPRLMGEPPFPHAGVQSNAGAFALSPQLAAPVTFTSSTSNTNPPVTTYVFEAKFDMALLKGQKSALLLNAQSGNPAPAFRLENPAAAADNAAGDPLLFTGTDLPPGPYFVRIEVDGAQSPLVLDPNAVQPPSQSVTI